MTVLLTSFTRWHNDLHVDAPKVAYSIAVYQPPWYPRLPEIDVFKITNELGGGEWVRPRNFAKTKDADPDALRSYHDALLGMYRARWEHDLELGLSLQRDHFDGREDVALCCWCPYDRAAKRQLEDYGSFVCHSWPVETFLSELGIKVVRDMDRERMVRL